MPRHHCNEQYIYNNILYYIIIPTLYKKVNTPANHTDDNGCSTKYEATKGRRRWFNIGDEKIKIEKKYYHTMTDVAKSCTTREYEYLFDFRVRHRTDKSRRIVEVVHLCRRRSPKS